MQPCRDIYSALRRIYEIEADLELETISHTEYVVVAKASVDLCKSLVARVLDRVEAQWLQRLTCLEQARAKCMGKRRPGRLQTLQLVRGLFMTAASCCRLFLAHSFSRQLKMAQHMSDEGEDRGEFETGTVCLRCVVRLDALAALASHLLNNFSKKEKLRKLSPLGCLLRLRASDVIYDLPLDALGAMMPRRACKREDAGRAPRGMMSRLQGAANTLASNASAAAHDVGAL